jgi:hypothetical protein
MPEHILSQNETITQRLLKYWEKNPLASLLIIAAIPRLISVLFSKGYGMSDDHFLIIEVAQRWIEGIYHWYNRNEPFLQSIIYPGVHSVLFWLMDKAGLSDPQLKMYVVRFIHGAYSLLIVYYGYLITRRISGEKKARMVGLALALLWCLPFLSVRNLREIICIPPLLAGFYYLQLAEDKRPVWNVIFCGFLFSVAFILRFQSILFGVGLGLYLLSQLRIKDIFLFSLGFAVGALIEGMAEWYAWGTPFITLYNYIIYNIEHAGDYPNGPWYQYFLTVLGLLLPPFSLALAAGFFKNWKKYAPIFWASVVFFVFHSYSPNKQERFIFPLLPFFLMLGITGWMEIVEKSAFWSRQRKLRRGVWIFTLVINSLALLVVSFTYTKRSRVESLYYLYHKSDYRMMIAERDNSGIPLLPWFYLDRWDGAYELTNENTPEDLKASIENGNATRPNYVVFFGDKNIEQRVARVKKVYPTLQPETVINISLVDYIAHVLNPRNNENETAYIYKIEE